MEKPNIIRVDEATAASLSADDRNKALLNSAMLQQLGKDSVTIEFVKNCGHRLAGAIIECSIGSARQYMAGGFAELWVSPEAIIEAEQDAPLYQEALNEADEKKG